MKQITNKSFFSVCAFQGANAEGDLAYNLDKTIKQLELCEANGTDVLCMPETFLHGYFETKQDAFEHSLDLESSEYARLLENFKGFQKTTLLLGLNERKGNLIYNTVIVIEQGEHRGQYRKAYTYPPYDYYTLGQEFPVFEKHGVRYGIIICVDSAYREPAHLLALKGAQIIFCPMFNRVKNDAKLIHYLNRKNHFISRAFENECWFVCSDIICADDGRHACAGYTTILDKDGEIVSKSQPFLEMLVQYDIPINSLRNDDWNNKHYRRLLGNPKLNELVNKAYLERSKK